MILQKLNQLIDQSDNVNLKDGATWWFDRETQRKYILAISGELVSNGVPPQDALDSAEELIQRFYEQHIQPSTRK